MLSKDNGKHYEIKKVNLEALRKGVSESELANKISALYKLEHPSILRLEDADTDGKYMYFTCENSNSQSLNDLLSQIVPLERDKCVSLIKQILTALEYAFKNNAIHGALCPLNIIIKKEQEEWEIKIRGFGYHTFLSIDYFGNKSYLSYSIYQPPETFKNEPATHKTDIWSVGIIAFILLTGRMPFSTKSYDRMVSSIIHSNPTLSSFHVHSDRLTEVEMEFLSLCLNQNPNQRLSAQQLLDHTFINPLILEAKVSMPEEDEGPINSLNTSQKLILVNALEKYKHFLQIQAEHKKYQAIPREIYYNNTLCNGNEFEKIAKTADSSTLYVSEGDMIFKLESAVAGLVNAFAQCSKETNGLLNIDFINKSLSIVLSNGANCHISIQSTLSKEMVFP